MVTSMTARLSDNRKPKNVHEEDNPNFNRISFGIVASFNLYPQLSSICAIQPKVVWMMDDDDVVATVEGGRVAGVRSREKWRRWDEIKIEGVGLLGRAKPRGERTREGFKGGGTHMMCMWGGLVEIRCFPFSSFFLSFGLSKIMTKKFRSGLS